MFSVLFPLLLLLLLRQSNAQLPAVETDSLLIARLAAAAAAAAIPSPEFEEILSPQRSPLARDLEQVCQTTAAPGSKPDLQDVLGPVRTVNISTGEFAYIRFGNTSSSRPPLVFITGFGSTLSWLPLNVVLELAKDQEIIAFDNRGMGLSKDTPSPDEPLTIPGMANDTAEIISALNLTKPTVMGVSTGGMVATALVVDHGEDVGVVVVAHGAAGGANSTAPSIEAVDALGAPSPPPLAYLSILWEPTRPGSVAACHAYSFTIRNPIQSPTNSTTVQRQADAITDWVSCDNAR